MPTCLPSCTPAECLSLPPCTGIIQLGSVAAPGSYMARFENVATGYVHSIPVTVDLSLVANVTLPPLPFLDVANVWRVWITLLNDALYDYQPISVNTDQYNCFLLTFTKSNATIGSQAITPLI